MSFSPKPNSKLTFSTPTQSKLLFHDEVLLTIRASIFFFFFHYRLTKWAKGERAFHFWLNTFFVDKEIEGSLAHDLTVSNPIADQVGGSHQHHASGSSEDSSAEDVPLRLSSTTSNGGSHHHANHNNHNHVHHVQHDPVDLGNNFQKQVSTSDDHLLRQVRVLQFCLALLVRFRFSPRKLDGYFF